MSGEQLFDRVAAAAEGTPYAVTRTEKGFDVALDLADARWWTLLGKAGMTKTYTHHVAVPGDGTYSVTDDLRTLEWVAGVPKASFRGARAMGRIKEIGVEKVWAVREDGTIGPVVDYTFSSEEGRDLVVTAAEQLGLEQRRGTAERIGIAFAVVGLAGGLLTIVVLLVLWATGAF